MIGTAAFAGNALSVGEISTRNQQTTIRCCDGSRFSLVLYGLPLRAFSRPKSLRGSHSTDRRKIPAALRTAVKQIAVPNAIYVPQRDIRTHSVQGRVSLTDAHKIRYPVDAHGVKVICMLCAQGQCAKLED
jgi:hypothetical protein